MNKVMRTILLSILGLFLLFVGVGKLNSTKLNVEEKRIYIESLPSSFVGTKLVHISDFHIECDSSLYRLKKIMTHLEEIEADIIVINGDFIFGNCTQEFNQEVSTLLEPLNNVVWKFYTLGEEDIISTQNVLDQHGFKLLKNQAFNLFNKQGEMLEIIGLDSNKSTIEPTKETTLLFTHQPNWLSNINLNEVEVAFTAHTHLGKIFVPFYKGIIKVEGATTIGYLDYEQVAGLDIYTSRGVSTSGMQIRYFNDPTIHFYRLDKK
jgi:predicted MPP superfamily phosphohydrolase